MDGAESLRKKLNSLSDLDFTSAIRKSCLLVENSARSNCPVDSGALRGSITHKVGKSGGEVYTNVSYAPYVEYGTGLFSVKGNGRQTPWRYKDAQGKWYITTGQKPRPFMHPALAMNRTKIKDFINNEIKDTLK